MDDLQGTAETAEILEAAKLKAAQRELEAVDGDISQLRHGSLNPLIVNAFTEGNVDRADVLLAELIKKHPEDMAIPKFQAIIKFRRGDVEGCLAIIRVLAKAVPTRASIFTEILKIAADEPARLASAMERLILPRSNRLFKKIGHKVPYWKRVARLAFDKGDYTKAKHLLERSLQVASNDVEALILLARVVLSRSGNLHKAEFYLQEAMAVKPNHPDVISFKMRLNLRAVCAETPDWFQEP